MAEYAERDVAAMQSALPRVAVAEAHSRVFKEECAYSFDTPYAPGGLFTNLSTFISFGASFVALDAARSSCPVYLHQTWNRIEREKQEDKPKEEVTKLAIGVEGGFQVEEVAEVEKRYQIALVHGPDDISFLSFPSDQLPMKISMSAQSVIDHSDAAMDEKVQEWQDELKETKYAEALIQVPSPPKISSSPADWVCGCGCGLKENLWMNLSDGYIGGGRKNWDGSGGCGAALQHFQDTGGLYPLCVKLGTLNAEGGDVFSYAPDEDDMVIDPLLEQHLAHFEIHLSQMKKVEKSMAELSIDLNMRFEWDLFTEAGKELVSLSGPGFVGLKNLGNTCYINSLLQLLFTLPEFKQRYLRAEQEMVRAGGSSPATDFTTQMMKLARGLLTDAYVSSSASDTVVSPKMLKSIVGRGHPEFATERQQDIQDYYQHFLTHLATADRLGGSEHQHLSKLFTFKLEERIECLSSGKVRYTEVDGENTLSLSVPTDELINAEEVAAYEAAKANDSKVEKVVPIVPWEKVLQRFAAPEIIDAFRSPETNQLGQAKKSTRLRTLPPYLFIQLRRYVMSQDWRAIKIDAAVPMPAKLDLSCIKGSGAAEGECLMKEGGQLEADPAIVQGIVGMGFGENAAKRACLATKNAPLDVTMEWLFAHMDDADLNLPLPDTSSNAGGGGNDAVSEESLAMLMSMGFGKTHSEQALRATDGDLERAAVWVMSHPEEAEPAAAAAADNAMDVAESECTTYELVGFASHMGPSTACGHYVAHIIKDGKWVLFNDRKVAESQAPPVEHGYFYLYRRSDHS